MSETEYAIGRHCGVTFAGLKVASLVNLHRGEGEVIRRLARGFRRKGFSFVCLRTEKERQVLYIYNEEELRRLLFSAEVRAFLEGYVTIMRRRQRRSRSCAIGWRGSSPTRSASF